MDLDTRLAVAAIHDRDDVETARRRLGETPAAEILQGHARDATLLLERDGLLRRSEAGAAAAFDLHETEDARLLRDQVDFPGESAIVALAHTVAGGDETLLGEPLPSLSAATPAPVAARKERSQ